MKVAQLHGPRDIHIDTLPDPVAKGTELVVKIAYCGLCGTDLHAWQGDTGPVNRPRTYPSNNGHEYAGTVVEVGEDVTLAKVGDAVTVNPYRYCGYCHYCRNGLPNFCQNRLSTNKGWAEYVLLDQTVVYPIPEGVSMEVASIAEALAAATQGIDMARMQSGVNALIIGGGPIGLSVMAMARRTGAAKVIVSEPSPLRRDLAKKMGADVVVNPFEEDLTAVVREATGGIGVENVFECVSSTRTIQQGIDQLANNGTIVVVGNVPASDSILPLSLPDLHRRQLTVQGTSSRAHNFTRTLNWLATLDLAPMITDIVPLEGLQESFVQAEQGTVGKVLLKPS